MSKHTCYLCESNDSILIADLRQKPAGETDFQIPVGQYQRAIYQCQNCSVYFSVHRHLTSGFYEGSYNAATYQHSLREKYMKIRNLSFERSDNKQRVRRLTNFYDERGISYSKVHVLDVGSGLCVFGGELKDLGFTCSVIDPDPLAAQHAIENAHINGAHTGTLADFATEFCFDLISFNKVLEHVPDPVVTLQQAIPFLSNDGVVYIEVPDGEHALQNGAVIDREEFYIEHFTVFTAHSLKHLTETAGLRPIKYAAIHEPSDKYTLYGFYEIAS
jgi:2-polyprenyl-3-methyl-5-hydroxy-6-metoxy-1,4-benzoquinol methylase